MRVQIIKLLNSLPQKTMEMIVWGRERECTYVHKYVEKDTMETGHSSCLMEHILGDWEIAKEDFNFNLLSFEHCASVNYSNK